MPAGRLEAETRALAAQIAANSPYAVQLGKRAFYQQQPLDMAGAYRVGRQAIVANAVHPEGQEGISAFLEKRAPHWKH